MSLDIDHLRRAFALALDEPPLDRADAEAISDLLGVREEILPHLVIKRGAFAASAKIRAALKAAAKSAGVRPPAPRDIIDPPRIDARDQALTRRLKAVIELESREAGTLRAAEQALRDRVLSSPPAAYDAHLRIRIPDQA